MRLRRVEQIRLVFLSALSIDAMDVPALVSLLSFGKVNKKFAAIFAGWGTGDSIGQELSLS